MKEDGEDWEEVEGPVGAVGAGGHCEGRWCKPQTLRMTVVPRGI